MAPSHGFQLGDHPSGPAGLAARERQRPRPASVLPFRAPVLCRGGKKEPKKLPLGKRGVQGPQGS